MTTEVQSQDVLLHEEGGVLTVTLNRPERRNAMSDAVVDVLERVIDDVNGRRGEVRVVVIRGAGGTFCAGGDLKTFKIGIPPAQISPYVTARLGAHQARRLMLTAADIDGTEAARVGLVDTVVADSGALDRAVADVVSQVRRCAPLANAVSKDLVHAAAVRPLGQVLDEAAYAFADALLGDEARAGVQAFVQRGTAAWAVRP